jgi:hypothetical protein
MDYPIILFFAVSVPQISVGLTEIVQPIGCINVKQKRLHPDLLREFFIFFVLPVKSLADS